MAIDVFLVPLLQMNHPAAFKLQMTHSQPKSAESDYNSILIPWQSGTRAPPISRSLNVPQTVQFGVVLKIQLNQTQKHFSK